MNINSKSILKAAAVVTALSVLGSAAWAVGEVTELRPALIKELRDGLKLAMDLTQKNTLANARQDFIATEEKIKRGANLSWVEKRDYCTNAIILEYPTDDSIGIRCTNTGEPDLVIRSKAQ